MACLVSAIRKGGFRMKYDCIDLTDLYNSKMIFSEHDDAAKALEDCFINSCFNNSNGGEIPFLFPTGTDGNYLQYDNISCEGQIIDVNNRLCKSIYCVGFCEWGDMCGEVALNYQNGTVRHSNLFFYDWYRTSRDFFLYDVKDENCSIFSISETMKGRKALYLYTISLDFGNGSLNTIQLPYIPNMHIFSITLEC